MNHNSFLWGTIKTASLFRTKIHIFLLFLLVLYSVRSRCDLVTWFRTFCDLQSKFFQIFILQFLKWPRNFGNICTALKAICTFSDSKSKFLNAHCFPSKLISKDNSPLNQKFKKKRGLTKAKALFGCVSHGLPEERNPARNQPESCGRNQTHKNRMIKRPVARNLIYG